MLQKTLDRFFGQLNTVFWPPFWRALKFFKIQTPLFMTRTFYETNEHFWVLLLDPTLRSRLHLEGAVLKGRDASRDSPGKAAEGRAWGLGSLPSPRAHNTRTGSGVCKFSICPASDAPHVAPGLQSFLLHCRSCLQQHARGPAGALATVAYR